MSRKSNLYGAPASFTQRKKTPKVETKSWEDIQREKEISPCGCLLRGAFSIKASKKSYWYGRYDRTMPK